MNAINCGGCAPPVIVETERQADQRAADELRALRRLQADTFAVYQSELRAAVSLLASLPGYRRGTA
jgi:hypothetical protein